MMEAWQWWMNKERSGQREARNKRIMAGCQSPFHAFLHNLAAAPTAVFLHKRVLFDDVLSEQACQVS
jgi:hypothetical protein